MSNAKTKNTILIVLSAVALLPNIACLLVATLLMHPAPLILYIVPSVVITAAVIGLVYGILKRKTLN